MTESVEQVAARRLEAEEEQRREARLRELAEEESTRREDERRETEREEARKATIVRCREIGEQRARVLDEIEDGVVEVAGKVAQALSFDREERSLRSGAGLPGQYAPPLLSIMEELVNIKIGEALSRPTRDPLDGVPLSERDPLRPK